MTEQTPHARATVAKAAIASVVASIVLIAVAYAVAAGVGKPQLSADIAMAGGLLLLAGLPGLALALALAGRARGGAALGFVAGIGVRLPAGGVVALYGLDWGLAKTGSFSQVVAGGYLVLLVVEVLFMSPAVKRTAAVEAGARTNLASGKPDPSEEPV